MSSGIKPLAALSSGEVRDYLRRNGHSEQIINWKYFDNSFNRGRERGYVYLQDGIISGFIGLIPFYIRHHGELREAAWTCDWYKDPQARGAMGLMLIKHCLQSYRLIYSSGGSSFTRQILPRLSANTVSDGVRVLHKPLRAAAVFNVSGDRFRLSRSLRTSRLAMLPLPFAFTMGRRRKDAVFTPGISDKLFPLLQAAGDDTPCPFYDAEHLTWQIGRCPSITCGSCYVPHGSDMSAGAVFWKFDPANGYWRIALWARGGATDAVKTLLSAITNHVVANGATLLSIMASRLDRDLLRTLRSCGFLLQQHRPLYIFRATPDIPVTEPHGLSFLDTDAAYR